MADAPAQAPKPGMDRRGAILGGVMLGGLGILAVWLLAAVFVSRSGTAAASPTPNPSDFTYADAKAAPVLQLTDQDGSPFTLSSLQGHPVLVFFGYTHCPDVCPATVGIVNEAVTAAGAGPRAVFVSIDPERDSVAAMKSYLKYLPPFYTGLSGTPDQIKQNSQGWGVQYAKVETGSANGYAMAHTADLYLVDAQGRLRAHFPFGTQAGPVISALKALLAETPVPSDAPVTTAPTGGAPTASAVLTPAPTAVPGALAARVISSAVWAGGSSPVILTVGDSTGVLLDGTVTVDVTVTGAGVGTTTGAATTARSGRCVRTKPITSRIVG